MIKKILKQQTCVPDLHNIFKNPANGSRIYQLKLKRALIEHLN